jgi:hypothetical protein
VSSVEVTNVWWSIKFTGPIITCRAILFESLVPFLIFSNIFEGFIKLSSNLHDEILINLPLGRTRHFRCRFVKNLPTFCQLFRETARPVSDRLKCDSVTSHTRGAV